MSDTANRFPAGAPRHPRQDFDVLVVGAGPAGSATALRLAQAGCSVLLLERSRFGGPRIGESLPRSVQPLLHELGLWEAFLALRPWPSRGLRSVWGRDNPLSHAHANPALDGGWHVDRLAFDRMLAHQAASAGAVLLTGTVVAGCEPRAEAGWRVHLAKAGAGHGAVPDESVPGPAGARLLVDATGRSASLARSLGAQRMLLDNLVCVATHWMDDAGGPPRARDGAPSPHYVQIETCAEGWWYSAPLPASRSTLAGMLFTDADVCGRLKLTQAPHWLQALGQAPFTQGRLREAARALRWGPHAFSAVSQRLRRELPCAAWFAAGDAALAVDPISGSGVVRALRAGQAACETALQWLQAGGDADRAEALRAYEAACDRECTRYLVERAACYALEDRWAQAPFWQRRGTAWAAAGSGQVAPQLHRFGHAPAHAQVDHLHPD